MRINYFTLLIFLVFKSYTQSKITGLVINEKNKPLSSSTIVITSLKNNKILTYAISNEKGKYALNVDSNLDSLIITVSHLGYKKQILTTTNRTQTINFKLIESLEDLKEVFIKSPPISKRGDTINYSVGEFSKEQDRTIADVLNRLPGIDVLPNGKILYQGKPINKYYIEGLDLLEGKYNLANKNLPHKEVSRVQILENHQPIKLLDSLVFSDKAALNIKLKNKYTFTGQAKIGSGLSPLLWDANITPLLFTKKSQFLGSYQSNNTGDDVANQINTLTIEDLLDQFETNSEKQDWLSVQKLNPPSFSKKRWLDNNIHLLSVNYLHKLKEDFELKTSVSYLNDKQGRNGFTNTLFFTASDTISLLENNFNRLSFNSLETNITLEKNTKNNYLKNRFQFQGFWDSQRGDVLINNNQILQGLNNQYFKVSNKFKIIFPIKKQLITLNSYILLNQTPQNLSVNPGQFGDLLNNEIAFEEINQNTDLRTFFSNNFISLTKGWKRFTFISKIGFIIERQNLESQILIDDNTVLRDEFFNDLEWSRGNYYIDIQTQYKKEKWTLNINTPINLYNYNIEDNGLQERQNLDRLVFEPSISLIHNLTSNWKANISGNIRNRFGVINELYYGYILNSYRNIRRINSVLPQSLRQSLSIGFSYRNPIKSLFGNISYNFANTDNNLLYENQILDDGVIELLAVEQDNSRRNHSLTLKVNKYLSDIKTNLSFNTNYNLQSSEQIINSELTDIENQNLSIGGKIQIDFTDWFNTDYRANWLFSKNRIQGNRNQTITQQSHNLNVSLFLKSNQNLRLETEYIKNNLFSETTENIFTDLKYIYTWKKKNIDLEIIYSNIFNTQNYRNININDFSYVETNFQLRPSQLLFKIKFSL